MYEGSAARRYDAYEETYAQRGMASSFGLVEGAGLDAQVRSGVTPQFLATIKAIAVAIVVLGVLCFARVSIYSATVGLMVDNTTMRTELKDAKAQRDELRIERSVLSSSTRIERIATQTYGMVLAESSETLTVGAAAAAAAAAAEAEAATQTAEASAEVQAADEAVSQDEVQEETQEDKAEVAKEALSSATITQGDGSTAGANAVDVDSL